MNEDRAAVVVERVERCRGCVDVRWNSEAEPQSQCSLMHSHAADGSVRYWIIASVHTCPVGRQQEGR